MCQRIRHLSRRITELRHENEFLENDNKDLQDEVQRQQSLHLSAREGYDELQTKNTQLAAKVHQLEQELDRVRKIGDSDRIKKIRSEAMRTIQERECEIDQLQKDNIRMQKKDEEIHKLQMEIIQYKRAINTSKPVGGQVSDTTIRDTMNGLFSAVRNWAMDVSRQDKLEIKPIETFRGSLFALVPDFQICKPKQKMHTLVAVFSLALVHFAQGNYAFGYPSTEPIKSATVLLGAIDKIRGVTKQRKKQWAILTNELLSKDGEVSRQTSTTLTEFISFAGGYYKEAMGSTFNSDSLFALETATKPFMQVIFGLHLQEAEYRIGLVFAAQPDKPQRSLDAKEMEDVYGEESGALQASLFPAITKEVISRDNTTERIVVCKAKVVVISE
ncbi:hypothetical protein KCU71_g6495, partial [Aureobasidium melanogenum]